MSARAVGISRLSGGGPHSKLPPGLPQASVPYWGLAGDSGSVEVSLIPPTLKGRGPHKGMNTRGQGLLGAPLDLDPS